MKSLGLLFSLFTTGMQRRNLKVMGVLVGAFAVLVGVFSVLFHVLMAREGQSHSWPTAVYWTLVTMTTLGFGDITFQSDAGRVFSVVVLLSGTMFLLVLLPFTFIQFVFAPWMAMREAARAPRRLPDGLTDHLLLTNYSPIEEALVRRARHSDVSYAVIVPDVDTALGLHDQGVSVMVGDLDDPRTFRAAGAERAALVVASGSDVRNTNTVYTVREVSATVPIVSTVSADAAVDIVGLAGADVVLQLGDMLGRGMAERAVAPGGRIHQVGHFPGGLMIAEVAAAGTPLAGHTLIELGLKSRLGLGVLGVWHRGRFKLAEPDTIIPPTGVLLIAGTRDQLNEFEAEILSTAPPPDGLIVIGGGRVGRAAGKAFAEAHRDYCIVEQRADRIRNTEVYVQGDAAELAVLERAGIADASAVVITTHDDDVNVYLSIYCRRLIADLRIVARANNERNVSTLYRAGADAVLSYASMGATAIWNHISDDDAFVVAEGLHVVRRRVPPALIGESLASSHLRRRTGCVVVAVDQDGVVMANPAPTTVFGDGDSLILIADVEAEALFTSVFPPRRHLRRADRHR